MNLKKYKNLPNDMIFEILSFDDRFILRRGKLMNRIPKNDKRYKLLSKIPQKKYNSYNNTNYVTIYINEKKIILFIIMVIQVFQLSISM